MSLVILVGFLNILCLLKTTINTLHSFIISDFVTIILTIFSIISNLFYGLLFSRITTIYPIITIILMFSLYIYLIAISY